MYKKCGKKLKFISECKTYDTFKLPNGKPDWSCTVEPTKLYSRQAKCSDGHVESFASWKPMTSFKNFKNKGLCEMPARRS